ncbi:hypothetical protein CL655_00860 [bacterium]|nr:hypothetical protein [bacterium]|tara:strand:- start:782 stop:1105 length:324 start_codon:yes stop_codon:yes gene_type:complete
MTPEKPQSPQERILAQYRLVPVVGLDAGELQHRLEAFFERLPQLKLDYTSHILNYHKDSEFLTTGEFDLLCRKLSLRTEVFTEFDKDYFDVTLDENIQIARERGSHA